VDSIPLPDILPVPAPVWLLQFLLILTFFLHLVPMNFLFGGGLLTLVSHVHAKKDGRHERLAKRIAELMPSVIALTVTLGVAPLLFVQVLYGHLLYSSSILMARAWFLVVPLVIFGYYGAYLLRFRWDCLGNVRPILAWGAAVVFAVVGFIYSSNFSLVQRPEVFKDHYLADPAGGHLNWSDPALFPRYLHMLAGAIAVSGIWFMILGVRRRSGDADWSAWLMKYGARVFTYATMVNIIIGFWYLAALPRRAMMIFMGKDPVATAVFLVCLVFIVATFGAVHVAAKRQSGRVMAIGAGSLTVVLVLMAVMRQQVRSAYLEPHFRLEQLTTEPQWGVFALFVVTLAAGLGTLGWMAKIVLDARSADTPVSGD
jgi:hypothetical protein